jgi:putative FmdB family regulatory protein
MPIYEFKCKNCGEVFEELVLGKEDGISCHKCGSKKVEKLMSAVALKCEGAFRGSKGSACASCKGGNCSSCK